MSRDPALDFWLRYAAREGALLEDVGDRALVVLPAALQERFGLPEGVTVTSDPEVAREEGALLLATGHPTIDEAAAAVLEEGDVSVSRVAWPDRQPPAADAVLTAARQQIGVDHGRIDLAGQPLPRYAPLLRIGVQVVYTVEDRYQEREEVWVDGRTGLVAPGELVVRLAGLLRADGEPDHLVLPADLSLALSEAHRLLEARTADRLRALARDARAGLDAELAQVEAFYAAELESIERRRVAAKEERRDAYLARADATRRERERRLHEIHDKYRPRHEIRPFRLHLVLVPALQVPIEVRRGERRFATELTWWWPVGSFASPRCPSCGAAAVLVATKERVGCRSCVTPTRPAPEPPTAEPPRVAAAAQPPPVEPGPVGPPPAAVSPPRSPVPAPEPGARARAPANGGRRAAKPVERAAVPRVGERDHRDEVQRTMGDVVRRQRRVVSAGNKLAGDFWDAMVTRDPWPRKRADADSPMRTLYRLYGAEGPMFGLGLPPGEAPAESTMYTVDPYGLDLHCTTGQVTIARARYPYTLIWHLAAGKPVIDEALPWTHAHPPQLPLGWAFHRDARARLYQPPAPRVELDPVAAAIWTTDLPVHGLPLVVRCLTAWWRVEAAAEHDAAAFAAAVAAWVGRRAGLQRTRQAAALGYGARLDAVEAAARSLQRLLRRADERPW